MAPAMNVPELRAQFYKFFWPLAAVVVATDMACDADADHAENHPRGISRFTQSGVASVGCLRCDAKR
jgi:hypothetical protein